MKYYRMAQTCACGCGEQAHSVTLLFPSQIEADQYVKGLLMVAELTGNVVEELPTTDLGDGTTLVNVLDKGKLS